MKTSMAKQKSKLKRGSKVANPKNGCDKGDFSSEVAAFMEDIGLDSNKIKQVIQDSNSEDLGLKKPLSQLLDQQHETKWFSAKVSEIHSKTPGSSNSPAEVNKLRHYAQNLHNQETVGYRQEKARSGGSDYKWTQTVLKSGTLVDKMAAFTVLIQESGIYCLELLDNLIALVNIKFRRECLAAISTLKDIFISTLLETNSKLVPFEKRPFDLLDTYCSGNKKVKDKILVLWYFESELKDKYRSFIDAVNKVGQDSVDVSKVKAVSCFYELLNSNPEQEQMLLTLLVNKLGNPAKKVSCQVLYKLLQLLHNHPNMKEIVVNEVERLIFRPNTKDQTIKYGVSMLNQVLLTADDSKLAAKLITMYFSLFKGKIKSGEVESKLMDGILTGINRAFPYVKTDRDMIEGQVETIYKVVHLVNMNVAIQALSLLYHITSTQTGLPDRFYNILYRKLNDHELSSSPRQASFLSLIYKCMKRDSSLPRLQAFTHRLLQACLKYPSHLCCAILIMLSQLLRQHPDMMKVKPVIRMVDEEEEYNDVKNESDDETITKDTKCPKPSSGHNHSWLHRSNAANKSPYKYDPSGRNPSYCHADYLGYFELQYLCNHHHPSVAHFAKTLAQENTTDYDGDPLIDFQTRRFLERFVFRNPKKHHIPDIASQHIMGRRSLYQPLRNLPFNSDAYLNFNEEDIPVDELFCYKFLKEKSEKSSNQNILNQDEEEDIESVNSEDFEEFMDEFEDEMDFADAIGGTSDVKKKRKKVDDSDDDLTEEEMELDDDISDIDFDDEEDVTSKISTKKKNKSIFAPADKFASMLEDNTEENNEILNFDKSDPKQLKWETKKKFKGGKFGHRKTKR